MSRSTHEIETPVGKNKVVINDWMTGGDKRRIMAGKDEAEKTVAMVTALVVSIDGKNEKLVETLDEMHGKDFDFVLTELAKVAEASTLSEKKS